MRERPHDDAMAEVYRDDPAFAARLLHTVMEDGDEGELLITLRQMAQAFGGLQEVAKIANLRPTDLDIYRERISPPQGNSGR
jgi:DNA-binding phage protein